MKVPSPPPPVFDIAIIGGGIAGAAIAHESALRGLSVVLFEKNKFGSGTSSKSSKLIHGGLRYLEVAWSAFWAGHFTDFWKNLRFVFLALKETHALAKQWPEIITEIELLMPIYKNQGRSRFSVFFGTWLYGILSQIGGGKKGTRILRSAKKALEAEPGLNPLGLLGAVIVQDHTTNDLDLVRKVIRASVESGAQVFEDATVTRYHFSPVGELFEVDVKIPRKTQTFYARKVINATGAWVDQVRENAGGIKKSEMIVPLAGSHVEVPFFSNYSTILQAEDKRIFFVINRDKRARIGTTERLEKNPDQVKTTEEEVGYLLSSVKKFFPAAKLVQSQILSMDAGIRALAKPRRPVSMSQISREHEFIFDPDGAIHVLGVKLTDHRRAAKELLDKLKI